MRAVSCALPSELARMTPVDALDDRRLTEGITAAGNPGFSLHQESQMNLFGGAVTYYGLFKSRLVF